MLLFGGDYFLRISFGLFLHVSIDVKVALLLKKMNHYFAAWAKTGLILYWLQVSLITPYTFYGAWN